MKKLTVFLLTLALTAIMPISSLAAITDITIKTDINEKSYIYNSNSSDSKYDISDEFGAWKEIDETITYSTYISLKFSSREENKAGVYFHLEAENDYELNHYSFIVKDMYGAVIFSDDNNESFSKERDIFLANITGAGDIVKEYFIEYKLSPSADTTKKITTLKPYIKLGDEVVATPASTVAPTKAPETTAKPTATLKPKFDLGDPSEKTDGVSFDFDTGEFIDDKPVDEDGDKVIEKICGKDISAGRYNVTGSGKLEITSASGVVKGSGEITDKTPAAVFIENGDVLKISALDGQESAKLKFARLVTDAKAPGVISDTNNKTNPKTGDSGMTTGITTGIVSLVALAVVGLEILKRKKNND